MPMLYGTPILLRTLLLFKMCRSFHYGSTQAVQLELRCSAECPYYTNFIHAAGGKPKSFVHCSVFLLVCSLLPPPRNTLYSN